MTSLASFFEAMQPFLERRASVEDTVARLGPSASGNARLGLYPELIRRQRRGVVDRFFRAAKAACDALQPSRWEALLEAFTRDVAPRHWEPNEYAKQLFDHVQTLPPDERLPEAVIELCDYAWIRFSAMRAAHQSGVGLDASLFVRQYTHEVDRYTSAVESGTVPASPAPLVAPCLLLVGRSRHTERLEILRPTIAALFALQLREDPTTALPAGIDVDAIALADADLVRRGFLAEPGR